MIPTRWSRATARAQPALHGQALTGLPARRRPTPLGCRQGCACGNWCAAGPAVPPRDAVLSPGEVILLLSWLDYSAADAFRTTVTLHGNARLRQVRVVPDYGMYDRRENPQYYPEVTRP